MRATLSSMMTSVPYSSCVPCADMTEVVLFTPYISAIGGVERLLLSLSRYLVNSGFSVRIACFDADEQFQAKCHVSVQMSVLKPKRNAASEAHALCRYIRVAPSGTKWLFFDLKSAFYLGLAKKPPAFVLHLTDPPTLLPADITKHAWSAATRLKSASRANVIQRLRGEIAHRVTKFGVRRARKVIVMTARIGTEVRALYDVEPEIHPPGIEAGQYSRARRYEPGPIHVLSISRLETSKRLDYVIRALAQLTIHDWSFHVVGDGDARQSLVDLASNLRLEHRVVFHGRLNDEEAEALYLSSHLFVMPAVQGYGLPALEALARGLPVILHKDSGVAEFLSNSNCVSVIDRLDGLAAAFEVMFRRIRNDELECEGGTLIPPLGDWCDNIRRLVVQCG
ncbi:MAG TPA: glycosyltransferase [Chthoniobacterales bacterium]|nr:glycosyltransferase [Chthoniobacterales bacterium]